MKRSILTGSDLSYIKGGKTWTQSSTNPPTICPFCMGVSFTQIGENEWRCNTCGSTLE